MRIICITFGLLCVLQGNIFAQFMLEGQFTDSETGYPLVGALVALEGTEQKAVTDEEGFFAFSGLSAGNYTLSCTSVGYKPMRKTIELQADLRLEEQLYKETTYLQAVTVYALKAYPVTQTEVSAQALKRQNLGQDLPVLLDQTPSLVYTSDAGAGVGYTGLRIRGSDAQRINVTLNGIPLNDSESHGVYWVNMPDFASSVQKINIQRGVGTSVNGAGAFGASINIDTKAGETQPYLALNNSIGSFNTFKHNLEFSTGLLPQKISFSGRLSKISSDGFIDRSSADLKSFFFSGSYLGKKTQLTLNVFSGKEITQQAWWGVPEAKLKGDKKGIETYILQNGLTAAQQKNIRQSNNRTYNHYVYDNEIDHYQQDHYQALLQNTFGRFKSNTALHYTRGRGYFEQAIYNKKFSKVGLNPVVVGDDTVKRSDYVVRRWLDNHFYGLIQSFKYRSQTSQGGLPVLDFVFGGGWNRYQGGHYGQIIWGRFAGNSNIYQKYYEGDGVKTDANLYAKANYQFVKGLFAFADLQIRHINYKISGKNNDFKTLDTSKTFSFFNPKVGLSYQQDIHRLYLTFAIAHKEPVRRDYTDNKRAPKPEMLRNFELGYALTLPKARLALNTYLMNYKDQLVPTGKVNDVGSSIRTNIPKSYRMGIELEGEIKPKKWLSARATATISENKNINFTEYIIDYTDFTHKATPLGNTDIALSPAVIAGLQLILKPKKEIALGLHTKYVGKQFLDNTQNEDRKIDSYLTQNVSMNYNINTKFFKELSLNVLVNNIFNAKYSSKGYTYAYIVGDENTKNTIRSDHFYPQAGINFLAGITIKF